MQIEFTITAKNKELFNIKLAKQLMRVFNDIDIDNTKILAIQFKDVDSFTVDNFIDCQFYKHDGIYPHEGKFYYKNELYEMVKPYCKVYSISIAEKYLGAKYPESERQKEIGYIKFAEYKIEQPEIKDLT